MGRWQVAAGAAALLLAAGCAGAAGGSSASGGAGGGAGKVSSGAAAGLQLERALPGVAAPPSRNVAAAPQIASAPAVPSAVIKTATLRVQVKRGGFDDAVAAAENIAARLGGIVERSTIEHAGARSGTVVLRVPSRRFPAALDAVRRLGRLQSQSITGKDVSRQFVDLGARLRNEQAQERVLLRLMARSQTVADTIRVQSRLEEVQLQIEEIRGTLDFLRNRTSLSTVTVTLAERGAGAPAPPSEIHQAFVRAWHHAIGVVTAAIVAVGVLIPIALMLGIALAAALALRPRLWPRKATE